MIFSTPVTLLIVGLVSIIGGLIQGVSGFGFGIFVMTIFPSILPYLFGVGLSSIISIVGMAGIVIRYRKHIQWKYLPVPIAFYMIASTLAINLSTTLEADWLKTYLGLFLVVLAFYFAFLGGKIKIKPNVGTAFIVSTMSGILSGLFSIGGPPMVIYYLAITKSKEEYLGTLQTFFLCTGIYNALVRIFKGIITAEVIPFWIFGFVGMQLGIIVGSKLLKKIDGEKLKKIVYAVIGCAGAWMFISNL
ncbi:MAG: sulfite exporter TauE/SafE family protein [Clostridia bacterium]|nr:sulfite exporter TauE/SafE family protein [Clostridia bacterium]MBQ6868071.1 sulfite exporter TauE/SafE family protein [Clostridia bacterium]MBQ6933567.1 sulfite exporter TauE/SafE family protein [Clostridia bacterium]